MKKQIVFILISAFAAAFTSCSNDDNGRDNVGFSPKSDQQMTVGPEAGTHTIYYDAYGEVYFTVSVNSGNESRTADIVLTYEGQALEFTVTQEPYASFTISVQESECTTGMVVWKVVPPDPELTYVSMAVDKATWDSFDSYEEYIAYDIEYFQEQAAKRNLSYEEFLEKYVLKQGEGTYSAEDLSADSDYIVYAYGMDAAGNILTDIYYAQARTLPVTVRRAECRRMDADHIGRAE